MPSVAVSLLVNTILARVRDPGAAVHTHPFCLDVLTRLLWLYNAQKRLTLHTATLTVQPSLALYTLTEATGDSAEGPQGILLLRVLQDARPLERMTFPQLQALDPSWFRRTGPRLEAFFQLGASLVLLWPLLVQQATVTTITTALTPLRPDQGTQALLPISQEDTPRLGQILELLLLLRQHDTLAFNALFTTFMQEIPHAASTAI